MVKCVRAPESSAFYPMIEYPPSTGMAVPVIKSEACEARNTAMPARSEDTPQRAAGVRARTLSCRPSTCSRARWVRSVSIQPGSTALAWMLSAAHARALDRGFMVAVFTADLFDTTHDEANRAAVRAVPRDKLDLVGLALHAPRNAVDKVLKGARLHG